MRIPALRGKLNGKEVTVNTNEDKSQMLAKTFFPRKPPEESHNLQEQEYPNPVCKMDKITYEQIRQQLQRLKPYKAPGPDTIPNIVLSKYADILTDRLYHIYLAILEQGVYYEPWRQFMMVVLHKPEQPKYDMPKLTD